MKCLKDINISHCRLYTCDGSFETWPTCILKTALLSIENPTKYEGFKTLKPVGTLSPSPNSFTTGKEKAGTEHGVFQNTWNTFKHEIEKKMNSLYHFKTM